MNIMEPGEYIERLYKFLKRRKGYV